ncbi:Protein EARLY FLOWERING 3 Nematode-responsive protein [Vigna angularis]|uniref:Protein EARLY FLOWERING 3 Nematode-responsive protein n=1 Tax=Phaseolus angularis TaxID=3914 RepID=A0A8T0KN14_PHAAN|nr:protein EARLY FLOWERING 3 isoform X1 [Vigna angularis]XP_052731866.1 protein EARLY FLOWERING 3 isoform X1 [Vigna angularis]KAG2400459.1 Protein EARLY FLOWERING 3 Nematode-responsive protein [Vigna angularis]
MKRRKDDEKVMGPMFPRLHVNDTEKGGPRAPPRNKMALYEQFSIPSQRFNSGVVPLNQNISSNTAPPTSSSQGTVPERNNVFPVHLPSQKPIRPVEKCHSRQSEEANLTCSLEQRKKVYEEDFRVPVYVHSRVGQCNDKSVETFDRKKITHTGTRYFGCSVAGQSDCERVPKQFGSSHVRKDARCETDGLPQVSTSKDQPLTSVRSISTRENIDTLVRQAKVTPNQEFQDCHVSKRNRFRQDDGYLRQDCGVGSQSNDIGHSGSLVQSSRKLGNGNAATANQTNLAEAINDTGHHDTGMGSLIRGGKLNGSDNASKISSVDNLSPVNISPDDVVGIIGQKQFWKARRAISHQQRVFAVQVFELHRLIKVQQLIAGSPEVLLEDGTFLGKSTPEGSTRKKLSLEYVVKPWQQNLMRKDDSEKLNHKMECSAENAVGKTSLSSVKNDSHLSNYTPFSRNPQQANVAADSGMGPWCFHQSAGHQWLVPVMTPYDGLVYKPYPRPGFTETDGGGCGPSPFGGNFMNPAYGIPNSLQGVGVSPQTPPGSLAYFPPYGMTVMNATISESAVDQVNQFSSLGSHRYNGHLPGGEADHITNNQSSFNLPTPRKGAFSHVLKYQTSKDFELQGSTASSPGEMAQGLSTGQVAEGRDVLPLFPMVAAEPESIPRSLETGQPTRVIKVVPHNRISATASAARIFQSIQEERKQYDSV